MTSPSEAVASPIPGIKALGMGGIGTGKTTLVKSLVGSGITPMCICFENPEILGDTPPAAVHWMYIPPVSGNIDTLRDAAKRIGTLGPDAIQKTQDLKRNERNNFYPFLDALSDFKCNRTGESFGNVSTWGTDRMLVVDGLSGLTKAAEKITVGEKYAMTQPEFQIVMKLIENVLVQIATGFWCHAYVVAHMERETDEVAGGSKMYPSTIGRKLAPVLGRPFSDVFMMRKVAGKIVIDTVESQADLKARNFPYRNDLPPSFLPAIESWKKRGGLISPTVPPEMLEMN